MSPPTRQTLNLNPTRRTEDRPVRKCEAPHLSIYMRIFKYLLAHLQSSDERANLKTGQPSTECILPCLLWIDKGAN